MSRLHALAGLVLAACAHDPAPKPAAVTLTYTEAREPCAARDALRRPLFGDLHVHTGFSFDAWAYENRQLPEDAYRFARGEAIALAPLAAPRTARLDRPLDFVAVTDHGDLLGEVHQCTTPGLPAYDTARCQVYRGANGAFEFGTYMAAPEPAHDPAICGADGAWCADSAALRWQAMQAVAEAFYDRSPACRLTTFVGYEYTNTRNVSNLHRNVIFRTAAVPPRPIGYQEAWSGPDLWRALDAACVQGTPGCDVLVLPHNSNLSNGQLFHPGAAQALPPAEAAELARLRMRFEPVVELFQHKGDSECRPGLGAGQGDGDCDFEKLRSAGARVCPEARPGNGGMRLWGCVHRLDFVRDVLLTGLAEGQRLGINPYALGFIGSTDTHNATPGLVRDADFPGHVGTADDSLAKRLGMGNITHDGVINNPGGLAGVWAVENSRDAIFEALRRRETFATSGPRLTIRSFARRGAGFGADLCAAEDRIARADAEGVPMGASLPPGEGPPSFFVEGYADTGGRATPLARLQIVKGWVDASGQLHHRVFPVAGDTPPPADAETCAPPPPGPDRLCAVWTDPDFDPAQPAFWYPRLLEAPTCRWSRRDCLAAPAGERPGACDDPDVPRTVAHRAWGSPVFHAGAP